MENIVKISENKAKFSEHKVHIDNRKKISITGVEKVISANENQIIAKTNSSKMFIYGKGLTVAKLDVDAGFLDITGEINGLKYNNSSTPQCFFKRLFK